MKLYKDPLFQGIADRRMEPNSDLRKTQLVELKLLQIIDAICRKHAIPYWIDGGTLLGAVRHGGFIPWDDDADICMLRKDYEHFLQIADKELPFDVVLRYQSHGGNPLFKGFAKVTDCYSTALEYGENLADRDLKGISIDIFPVDKYPYVSNRTIAFFIQSFQKSRRVLNCPQYITPFLILRYFYRLMVFFFMKSLWFLLLLFSPHSTRMKYPIDCTYSGKYFEKSTIFPLKELTFEHISFSVPNDSDTYLKVLYGDYMKYPPEKDRKGHLIYLAPTRKYEHKDALEWDFQTN